MEERVGEWVGEERGERVGVEDCRYVHGSLALTSLS